MAENPELYDLNNDPGEILNLGRNPECGSKVMKMEQDLEDLIERTGFTIQGPLVTELH